MYCSTPPASNLLKINRLETQGAVLPDKVRAALIPCDRLVGTIGDRGAKPLARPFLLSSCSATGVKRAFFVQLDYFRCNAHTTSQIAVAPFL